MEAGVAVLGVYRRTREEVAVETDDGKSQVMIALERDYRTRIASFIT